MSFSNNEGNLLIYGRNKAAIQRSNLFKKWKMRVKIKNRLGNHGPRHVEDHNLKIPYKLMGLVVLTTFAMFMILDPNPDLLLSSCVAANVGIMLWALYRLYQWDLLLSPMASCFLGVGMLFYYTWGNLGARIAAEGRFGSNPGSLAYYPMAALLTMIGLLLFVWVVFFKFAHYARRQKIKYKDLFWQPWQAPVAASAAVIFLLYLSSKYVFINGYFRGVDNYFDQWLCAAQYFFLYLAVVIGVSVTVRATNQKDLILGISCLILIAVIAIGMRSRTSMVQIILTGSVCWIILQPRRVRFILVIGSLCAVAIFGMGSLVKSKGTKGQTKSISDNVRVARTSDLNTIREGNEESFQNDYQYRLAGLEYPAAILMCLDRGAFPMYGEGMYGGILQGLPNFLRPEGVHSERAAIGKNFRSRGLKYDDSIGIPLTSGLADWGLPGTLIYGLMAFYCLILWRVMQISPRMFVVFLTIGPVITDLFWDSGFYVIRAVGFSWLALLVLSPILMPRWIPASDGPPPKKTSQGVVNDGKSQIPVHLPGRKFSRI